MAEALPRISVVICTHNRKEYLLGLLETLAVQTAPAPAFEVIVVADACTDGTEEAVRARTGRLPYRLRLSTTRAGRPAVPRNLGAARARGEIILFVDDDMAAGPLLVEGHLHAHAGADVVPGYSPYGLPPSPRLWQMRAAEWWEDRYASMRRTTHIFGYDDLITTNVSIKAALFRNAGGFDETMDRLEDYDLGIRLIRAGARFGFADAAAAVHRDTGDGSRWLARLGVEGMTYALLERKYPEMGGAFHREPPPGTVSTRIRRFSLLLPRLANRLIPVVHHGILEPLERMKARGFWERALAAYGELTYWSGVSQAATVNAGGSIGTAEPPPVATLHIGQDGVRLPAESELDRAGAVDVRLFGVPVGTIASFPRGEALSPRHLHDPLPDLTPDPWIGTAFTRSLTEALRNCTGPVAIRRRDLESPDPVSFPAGASSICLVVFHAGIPVGFFPIRAEDAGRWTAEELRNHLLTVSRIHLRAQAAHALLAASWLPDTPPPAAVILEGAPGDRSAVERALEAQTIRPARILFRSRSDEPIPAVSEPVLVVLPAGLIPETGWLEAILRPFADPATGVVFGAELPGGTLTDTLRAQMAACHRPPPGLDVVCLEPAAGGVELLRDFRDWHDCRSMAVRAGALRRVDGAHIFVAEECFLSGYTVRYEPSAVLWDLEPGSPADPARAAVRGRECAGLLTPDAPGRLRSSVRLLAQGAVHAARVRTLRPVRSACSEITAALRESRTRLRHTARDA